MRERDPVRGAPENGNDVRGPGTLRAVVKSDSLHHPFIYPVDPVSNAWRRLCRGSSPRFPPDGRWIGWIDVASESLLVLASDTDLYVVYHGCEWAPASSSWSAA